MSRKLTFKSTRICKECGKEFVPRSGTQLYCPGPHFTYCKECGKIIEYTCSPKEKPKYCSKDCRELGRKKSNLSKYGVENVSQIDEVRKKISEANSSEEVRAKRESTCLRRYGTKNVAQNEDVKKKMSEVMSSEEYLKNRERTCVQRYGFRSPSMNPNVQEKRIQTNMSRYGCYGRKYTASDYASIMVDGSKVNEYLAFKEDPKNYILTNYDSKPTVTQLEQDLGVTNTPIYEILVQHDCRELVNHNKSSMESQLISFLNSLDSNMLIIENDRTQIKPYELDIYLPQYKIAFECNPASTHNSSKAWLGDEVKSPSYHKMKTDMCEKQGIFLFHIFGYEWNLKNNIIKSMIRNLLGKNKIKIGARSTYIDTDVQYEDCKQFLNENHRQGNTAASIRLGLRRKSDDKLVAVMTFGKIRGTMGTSKCLIGSNFELSRFCNLCNTSVIGGASKLFKFFVENYSFDSIVSFSDRSHTRGEMYHKLGFIQDSVVAPGYFWTDVYDTKHINRVLSQKSNLSKLLHDNNLDLSKTEREIMEDHNYVRTFDSGLIKWVYTTI